MCSGLPLCPPIEKQGEGGRWKQVQRVKVPTGKMVETMVNNQWVERPLTTEVEIPIQSEE